MNTTDAEVCELVEGRGREVEVVNCTACASISDHDLDLLSLVMSRNRLLADGVVVRVPTSIARE